MNGILLGLSIYLSEDNYFMIKSYFVGILVSSCNFLIRWRFSTSNIMGRWNLNKIILSPRFFVCICWICPIVYFPYNKWCYYFNFRWTFVVRAKVKIQRTHVCIPLVRVFKSNNGGLRTAQWPFKKQWVVKGDHAVTISLVVLPLDCV